MMIPKIISVQPLDNYQLLIAFSNGDYRHYDTTRLLTMDMFAPLKNPAFFKQVKLEQGGYAISWNADIDISEYELWTNGKIVNKVSRQLNMVEKSQEFLQEGAAIYHEV